MSTDPLLELLRAVLEDRDAGLAALRAWELRGRDPERFGLEAPQTESERLKVDAFTQMTRDLADGLAQTTDDEIRRLIQRCEAAA